MDKKRERLKTSVIQGFGTLIFREFFLKLFSFVGQIFLARLLFPSDFGIYVIIAFIINALSLFTDVGLSLAIIQKHKELTKKELSEAFFLKLLLSLGMILFIWIFTPYLQFFYPTLTDESIFMTQVFSLTFLASCFRIIPVSLLERKVNYNLISLVDILGVITFYVISLGGALMHFGSWSLIVGSLAKEYVETVVLFFLQPFFPQFTFSFKSIKKMVKFGVYLQGTAVVNVINASIIPIIGGRTKGVTAVGFLDFAYNIASIPEIIAVNFGRVAFAGYSRIQKQKNLLITSISKSMSMLSILLYVFPLILFGFGQELISLIFSAKWESAVPAIYWYSAGTVFLPIISSMGQGILVIGKSKEIFWTSFATAIIGWFGALFLVRLLGFTGIAAAYFFITFFFSASYIIILKRSNYVFPVLSILFPKVVVLFLSLLVVVVINIIFPQTIPVLILKLFLALSCYFMLLLVFVRKDTVELWRLAVSWLRKKKV